MQVGLILSSWMKIYVLIWIAAMIFWYALHYKTERKRLRRSIIVLPSSFALSRRLRSNPDSAQDFMFGLCEGMMVVWGCMLASKISEKTVYNHWHCLIKLSKVLHSTDIQLSILHGSSFTISLHVSKWM